MLVAIHQPNFLPWLGFFAKWKAVDHFIILDDSPFTKGSYQNRCRIKAARGPEWLTVPILTKGLSGQLTKDVSINNKTNWPKKHLNTIKQNYYQAKYYELISNHIIKIYDNKWKKLTPFCLSLLHSCAEMLHVETPVTLSSDLSIGDLVATERLIALVKAVGGDAYLSGQGGRKYMENHLFAEAGIELIYTNYVPEPYTQQYGDFVPGLSVIDFLFNCGENSEIIKA